MDTMTDQLVERPGVVAQLGPDSAPHRQAADT
jgi:hypothetical protein